jgi:hypothetical protein
MYIIPGNIAGAGVAAVVRFSRLPGIYRRLVAAIRWPVEVAIDDRPETSCSPVMLQRSAGWRWCGWMRRSNPRNMRYSRIGKGLARGKDERDSSERCDKPPTRFMGHGTHHSKGYGAAFLQTPSRAFRAREDILNF